MLPSIKPLLVIVAITVLAGCATPVPKIDSSPDALANVKTIAVIRSPEPKTYTVLHFGCPTCMFVGPLGVLAEEANRKSKQDILTHAIREKNETPTAGVLAQSIATQLTRRGFIAKVEEGPWEWNESDNHFQLEHEKITSSADAVLLVAPGTVGFIAKRPSSDYLPTILVVTTLLGKDRKELLYRGYHAVGWKPPNDGWRHSPPKVTFSDFDALMADPEKTAAALTDAASEIAVTVAEDLKR